MKFFLLLAFGATLCSAAQLSISPYWSIATPLKSKEGQREIKTYSTVLIVKNTGATVCILPKANLGPTVIQDNDKTTVWFSITKDAILGNTITPSLCEFYPVKLLPGEALAIPYELILPASQNPNNVTYRYEVPHEFAKEFGFEAVKFEAKLIQAPLLDASQVAK